MSSSTDIHQLEPLDLSQYADRKVPIDVVIGRERTQRSQVVKQADVVALLALLPEDFPGAMAETNFRHYEPRTAHGSSLSAGMHALVAARLGEADMALRFLHQAAAADLEFDPNSAGGIRIAGLGGVWQAVVLGFAGLDIAATRSVWPLACRRNGAACRSRCAGTGGRCRSALRMEWCALRFRMESRSAFALPERPTACRGTPRSTFSARPGGGSEVAPYPTADEYKPRRGDKKQRSRPVLFFAASAARVLVWRPRRCGAGRRSRR